MLHVQADGACKPQALADGPTVANDSKEAPVRAKGKAAAALATVSWETMTSLASEGYKYMGLAYFGGQLPETRR